MFFKKKSKDESKNIEMSYYKLMSLKNIDDSIKHEKEEWLFFNILIAFFLIVSIAMMIIGFFDVLYFDTYKTVRTISDMLLIVIGLIYTIYLLIQVYQLNKVEKSIIKRLEEAKQEIKNDPYL